MADFHRVVFVAAGWRRIEDVENGVIRMEAMGAASDAACEAVIEPDMQGAMVNLGYTCKPKNCAGRCELEIHPSPDPADGELIDCVCYEDAASVLRSGTQDAKVAEPTTTRKAPQKA